MKKQQIALLALTAGLILAPATASFAQGDAGGGGSTSTGAVDKLKEEADKVPGIYDKVVPLAVGSMVFGAGALLFKRIVYS